MQQSCRDGKPYGPSPIAASSKSLYLIGLITTEGDVELRTEI
ncbi:hypothetical protein [Rhizobium sp. 2MFCol3.1]|nr:hypothetical protein [Rhizobium sp. 2MFCol3.1]